MKLAALFEIYRRATASGSLVPVPAPAPALHVLSHRTRLRRRRQDKFAILSQLRLAFGRGKYASKVADLGEMMAVLVLTHEVRSYGQRHDESAYQPIGYSQRHYEAIGYRS